MKGLLRQSAPRFVLVGVFLLKGSCAAFAQTTDADFQNADAEEKAGNLKAAIESYTKFISRHPEVAAAFFARAGDERNIGDLDSSIADYSRCIELRPNESAYAQRAYSKNLKGDQVGALSDAEKSLRLSPSSFAYMLRSHARRLNGDLLGAINDMTSAIALEPDLANYNIRALCEEDAGKNDEALADFLKTAVSPASEYSHLRIWLLRSRLGEKDVANAELLAYLNTRQARGPDDWFAKVGNFMLGKIDEKSLLDAASNSDMSKRLGRQCEANFYVGCVRLLNKNWEGAADCFKKCVQTGEMDFDEYQSAVTELRMLGSVK